MNLVFMCIDTLRYDHLGCNGNAWIHTPNLDAFAREAIVFDNAYAGSWPTIPHRTDVFKGRFGQPLHPWLPLGFSPVTMPNLIGQAGYATYLVFDTPHLINGGHGFDYAFHGWHFERGNEVDQHIIDDLGPDRGHRFDQHYGEHCRRKTYPQYVRNNRFRHLEDEWPSPRVFKAASEFIEMNRGREKFFLWIDCFDPHEPWDPPDHYVALYDDPDFDHGAQMMGWEPLQALSPEEVRHAKAHYAGEVSMVDRHVGRFLDRLAATGRDKDTAVIITCDHGTNLGEHGRLNKSSPVYEGVGHQVLMARIPGVAPVRKSALVQPADMMPTLLPFLDLSTPASCQGLNLLDTLTGSHDRGREVAVTGLAIDVNNAADPAMTVQDARWCLIDRPDPAGCELYDKSADRLEERNVVAQHPQEAARLHAAALEFLRTHEAHPALVQWFETGAKGDTTGYQFRPSYLAEFVPYFNLALDIDVQGM
jgi:arylsulfatase A-like enzyme